MAVSTNAADLKQGLAPELSMGQLILRRFLRHRLAMVGSIMLLVIIVACLAAPLLTHYRPAQMDLNHVLSGPSALHPFGTDSLGHDVFTQVLYGGQMSLLIGFSAMLSLTIVGVLIGALAGYYGGLVDGVLMRFTDIMLSFPTLLLAIALSSQLGGQVWVIIFIIAVFGWMSVARIVRGQFLSLKRQEFIEAAHAVGASDWRIMARHIIPNAMAPVLVNATLAVGNAIIVESSLSFLGLGVQPPTPTWGNMLGTTQQYAMTAPWLIIFPGLAIVLTILSVNFIGDGLRDALDPKLRR